MTRLGSHDRHAFVTGMCARQGLGARRQRPRRIHDKVCACGDNTLGTHTTRSWCAHNKDVHATKDFYRNIDSMSRQTYPLAKKKKKLPLGIWASQLRLYFLLPFISHS